MSLLDKTWSFILTYVFVYLAFNNSRCLLIVTGLVGLQSSDSKSIQSLSVNSVCLR